MNVPPIPDDGSSMEGRGMTGIVARRGGKSAMSPSAGGGEGAAEPSRTGTATRPTTATGGSVQAKPPRRWLPNLSALSTEG